MKAKKENKIYRINSEQEKQRYLKEGYDIYNDEGVLVQHSPLKKIEYSKYDALLKEKAVLTEQLAAKDTEVESLKEQLAAKDTEVESLKEQLAAKDTKAGKAAKSKGGE